VSSYQSTAASSPQVLSGEPQPPALGQWCAGRGTDAGRKGPRRNSRCSTCRQHIGDSEVLARSPRAAGRACVAHTGVAALEVQLILVPGQPLVKSGSLSLVSGVLPIELGVDIYSWPRLACAGPARGSHQQLGRRVVSARRSTGRRSMRQVLTHRDRHACIRATCRGDASRLAGRLEATLVNRWISAGNSPPL
jgi:hypothetical protein